MKSLAAYLREDYPKDYQQLQETLDVIGKVVPLFYYCATEWDDQKVGKVKTWPYQFNEESEPKPLGGFSHSTHSMIVFALDAVLRGTSPSPPDPKLKPVLFPMKVRLPKIRFKGVEQDQLSKLIRDAKVGIVKKLVADLEEKAGQSGDHLVTSGTFGHDDPLTLTWLAELSHRCRASADDIDPVVLDSAKKALCDRALKVCERYKKTRKLLQERPNELPSTFLKLRCLQLAKVAGAVAGPDGTPLPTPDIDLKLFQSELYLQLGYFTVADSRFDSSALAFAMEGVLQIDPYTLSEGTIDRLMETLNASRQRNPHWRPGTPFLATSQGMVLFPVSVEIMSSIIRSCEILEGCHRPSRFAQVEPLLRDYAQWLFARAERVRLANECFGWHSEHVNLPATIHLWETSLVLLFLVHYASMLQKKIAADGRTHANLSFSEKKKPYTAFWEEEPLNELAKKGDNHYRVLAGIYEGFINRRQVNGDSANSSLLLYGPPGTGKTTVAEQMATSLGWQLLVITVSDFLADGPGEVEARAKDIFRVLREQQDIVILFDEIDQFLLDRSSDAYREQTGIFQFLTPGMLTKFQDLKEAERSIFIVATNYEERIDSAIKRQGRFDERVLLCLPDTTRRRQLLWLFLRKQLASLRKQKENNYPKLADELNAIGKVENAKMRVENAKMRVENAKMMKRLIGSEKGANEKAIENATAELNNADAELDEASDEKGKAELQEEPIKNKLLGTEVGKRTALFGYGDLNYLVERVKIKPEDDSKTIAEKLEKAAERVQPAVRVSAYSTRFPKKGQQHYPFEEFGMLLYLVGEAGGKVGGADRSALVKAERRLKEPDTIASFIQGSLEEKGFVGEFIPKAETEGSAAREPRRNVTRSS